MSIKTLVKRAKWMFFLLPTIALCAGAGTSFLTGKQLSAALERGGYVILMRHANSPATPPDPAHAEADNLNHERELDETGRTSAHSMGEAFRRLRIPVGAVLSSPTYRALETVRLAGFPKPQTFYELGDGGKSMSSDASGGRGAWLKSQVARPPKAGTDTLIMTHYPNIKDAFADDAKGLEEGEALVFRPDGHGAVALVARVKISDWPVLAARP